MKPIRYISALAFFIAIIVFASCKKDAAVTIPVKFTSTSYKSLGSYDATGLPLYLVSPDVISPEIQTFISQTLPEQTDLRISNPELLTTKAIADIKITGPSQVFITYVSRGTGYTNSLAFYTYPTGQSPTSTKDIDSITFIFPSCGNKSPLNPGDKVKIGNFASGTSIGFVLLRDGWDTTSHKLRTDVIHFCSNDILNPEVDPNLKKHAVMISYPTENKVLIGFEDIDRTSPYCDHDFNDLVVYSTVTQ
ncbi:MAG: DUF4114 domain-containing protein [Ginsengibacter sp.]